MTPADWLDCAPSPHARALAGLDLFAAAIPALTVLPAAEKVVVVSRSRAPAREVYLERCAADAVPVVIRPSGGGAVVLAPGVVTANIVTTPLGGSSLADREFRRFGTRVAMALAHCGVPDVTMRGVSDLCLGDRKIAGTALRLWRGLVLFQLSLLVDMDLALLERYLPFPTRVPHYRQGRPHLLFVTSLRQAGLEVGVEEIVGALTAAFSAELPVGGRVEGIDGKPAVWV